MAFFFVLGTSKPGSEADVYLLVRQRFDAFVDLMDTPVRRFSVLSGPSEIPVYLFRPAGAPANAPTVIMNNGSDGQTCEIFPYVAGAIARGLNAVLFDGPGQGSSLFLRKVPFRPDWNAAVSPVIDGIMMLTGKVTDAQGRPLRD